MLETSSSPAAEAMTPFASPMLASIERLVSRLAQRVAGPQSQFSGRALQFADRIFSRRLDTLGMGAAPERQFAEREMEPQSWLLPKSWVPSAAALRGGPAGAQPAETLPASKRAAAAPLVLPPAAKPAELAAKPAATPTPAAATPPVAAGPIVAGRPGLEVAMPQVAPSWSDEKVAPVTQSAPTLAGTTAPSVAAVTTKATTPAVGGDAAAATVAQTVATTPAAEVAAAGAVPSVASAPELGAPPASAEISRANPQVAASTVAAPTIQGESRPAALPVGQTGVAPEAARVEAGATSAVVRARDEAGTTSASAVADSSAPADVAATRAGVPVAAEPRLQSSAEVAPIAGLPTVAKSTAAAPLSQATVMAAAAAGVARPLETRVRDLLPQQLRRTPAAGAPPVGHFSAFSRSLGHLGWSDDRLGRTTAERSNLPSLDFDNADEPVSSPRAAAAPMLPMVRADELTPRPAVRSARQVGQPLVAPESATPARAVAPLRQPVAVLPSAETGTPPVQTVAAAPSVPGVASAAVSNVPAAADSAVAGTPPSAAAGLAATPTAPLVTDSFTAPAAAGLRRESGAAPSYVDGAVAPLAAVAPTSRLMPAGSPAALVGLGAGAGSPSPSLLASPALSARGPASLVELFLSGQSTRAGTSVLGTLPSLAATQPYRTPGALASFTERMATAIGTHVTGGAAGVDNPFGGEQRWSAAPGLTRSVARALGRAEAEAEAPDRWTQLSSQLPYLQAPVAARPATAGAAAKASLGSSGAPMSRAAPSLTMAPAGIATSASPISAVGAATTRALQPEPAFAPPMERMFGPSAAVSPTVTSTPVAVAGPSGATSLTRPWQLAGGMATLAELFAAGVGVGTGAAGDIARQAGVAPAAGLVPPWLTKAASRSTFGLAARELTRRNEFAELEFVSEDGSEPEVKSADPMVRAMSRATVAAPAVAAPPLTMATGSAAAPGAESSPTAAAPSRMPFWQQAGGLAATAEAFAGGHGIGRMNQDAAASSASAGQWVPVSGGMVFVSDEAQRSDPSAASAAAAQPRAMSPALFAAATSRAANPAAWPLPASSGFPQAPSSVATPEATAVAPGPLSLGRGVDWGRAGGLGLRTELFAAGLGSANLGAQPLSAARDLTSWSTAPGVAAPLARALRHSEPTTPARWTFGDSGLLFVSAPLARPASSAAGRAARFPAITGNQPTRQASPVVAPGAAARSLAPGLTGGDRAAALGTPAVGDRPWLQPGGTAILAELFSAGVGLGSGAASDMAQQAGVAAGRGPLPSWLSRIMSSTETTPSSLAERLGGAGAALPFVPRAERAPASARVQGVPQNLARPTGLGLPVLGATPVRDATASLSTAAAATDRRPLPVTATASPALWQRAGGLAASAEAFARGRGMESTADDSNGADEQSGETSGRWLPVSGGMVFVPRERPTAAPATAAATRAAAQRANLPTVQRAAAAPAARATDWQRAGGLGLRSELFAQNLGQSAAAGAGSDPLGGWASSHRMLASFPQQPSTDESPTSRFAWNGPGGLLYLAGESPAQRRQRAAAPTVRRTSPATPVAASAAPAFTAPVTRAERFSSELGAEAGRPSERASATSALPLTALFGGREGERPTSAGSSASGAALPASLASAMLTSFPRSGAGGSDAATALWPRSAMQSADRLSQLLAQLPAQWTPSAALAATMQASGAADASLWQRLSPNLVKLAGAALRNNAAGSDDESPENALSERQPPLTMVKGGASAAAQKTQRPAEPAWKQQTPQAMVSAALHKVAGSGTPMATAAKMLESIRGNTGGQSARSDDRISLGDMTLIALSMGENKMAAATQGHSPSTVPHVETALRQGEEPNEPENEHTLSKKVDALAKMVLKYVEKNDKLQKERGDFDA